MKFPLFAPALLATSWLITFSAVAQSPDNVSTVPTALILGYEQVKLPAGERMGLVGAQYLFEPWSGVRIGPAAYGAATGERGGLFTWGGEVQFVGRPDARWQWSAGLYAGGGGGSNAPVGGGLMLRPHVDLWWRLSGWQLGVSASQVRFPSGQIGSSQLGLLMAIDDRFAYTAPDRIGAPLDWLGAGGIGFDRVQAVAAAYRFRGGATGSMGHVGVRLDRRIGPSMAGWQPTLGLEAAGAAHGGADGYAEALGTLGAEYALGRATLGVRGALGLAGGGAVPTRGGSIAKLALNATVPLGSEWFLAGEVGRMRALQGPLRADYAQLGLGFWLDQSARPGVQAGAARATRVSGVRWGLAVESYSHARRKFVPTQDMQTIGLRFDRQLTDVFYLTGQAHSAFAGGAGAYSMGLVGLGGTWPVTGRWRVGAELLAGAAGGGGVAVNGGAVVQPMLVSSYDIDRFNRLQVGAGRLRALKGDLSTPVLDVSWIVAFGVPEQH